METALNLIVSFKGSKHILPLVPGTTVEHVKSTLIQESSLEMTPHEIKLLFKGKVLKDGGCDLYTTITSKKDVRIIAMGMSQQEIQKQQQTHQLQLQNAPRIRNDLTQEGRRELTQRRLLGQKMLAQANSKQKSLSNNSNYKFHRIETLPMLPDQSQAQQILTQLANDPGILACLAKHKWSVGCLAELYPEGKVGESAVCVMGLNQNKGQKILLRIRTDDLRGFRKILSIRRVLFHELAHNVYSEHDSNFFQLMRQVEKECNGMDWTQGAGSSVNGGSGRGQCLESYDHDGIGAINSLYIGGSGRVGGDETNEKRAESGLSLRELTARAAIQRMSQEEEEEITQCCGCGQPNDPNVVTIASQTTLEDIEAQETNDQES